MRARIATRVLQRRAAALEDRDRGAYLATVDPKSRRLITRAGRTYDNLVRMGVADVRFTTPTVRTRDLPRPRRQEVGPGAWAARSELSFRLPGPSRYRWTTTLRVALVERAGRWYVGGHPEGAGASEPRPLWMQGRVEVVRGDHSTVIGTGSVQRLRTYVRLADRAVPAVSETWGRDWARYVVVVVPGSEEQMERRLGAEPGSQRQVASVTTTAGRSDPERAPYILVNPASFTGIGDIGQQVVLTHETVHVATRATTTVVPVWLSEGFADYVGFADSGLAPRAIGHQLIERVRSHGLPERLPTEASFAPQAAHLERSYEEAWSACRYIAQRWDEATLVAFYRAMDGAATDATEQHAYRQVLGVTPHAFRAGWRSFLEDLAG